MTKFKVGDRVVAKGNIGGYEGRVSGMKLREAIEHCKKQAQQCISTNRECATEHMQLARWLNELVAYQNNGQTPAEQADMIEENARIKSELTAKVTGDTSDGYHTFNELYHHRAVLFSVMCNGRPDLAWKSKQHHDGTMYDGMFIVGINTSDGQATYHYDIDPYWDMFHVPELPQAPEWDGHTPAQAIDRIGKLADFSLRTQLEQAKQERGEDDV